VIQEFAQKTRRGESFDPGSLAIDGIGGGTLQEAHPSWTVHMLLGALEYYKLENIKAMQISPGDDYWTIDIPNMKEPWSPTAQRIWKWLNCSWDHPVPEESQATTNLDALRGQPITELVRWEKDDWEMFAGAGPDVDENDVRIVPLGTMLGHDESLECIVNLEIGSGLWRKDGNSEWHPWEREGA
jgi:hypothetical protein